MLSYILRKVFPHKLRWREATPDEHWRFHVFGFYYLAEDEYNYWIVYQFVGQWSVKSCAKVGKEWGQWMGGCLYCIDFNTPEAAMAYAQEESIRYDEIRKNDECRSR